MEIKNLNKSFGVRTVFENLNLEIPENKITFLMGPSGCGKTTLIRMISGLDKDFTGEIIKSSNDISYVFQEPRLFPSISIRKNLEIIDRGASALTIDKTLKLVELDGEEDSLPDSLSGGMKMRLSLARALLYNGDIFLMDEPFSALDENMKSRIAPKIFKQLQNKTVIVISHDIEDAKLYSDNIITL